MTRDDSRRRRYSEEEFALILRKASELQPPGDRSGPEGTPKGLTLEEMRSIAAEAGIDPDAVTRAASLLGALAQEEKGGRAAALFGGPSKYHLDIEVPRRISQEEVARILEKIRKTLEHQGEVSEVMGEIHWKTVGEPSVVNVNISPRGDRTFIQVVGDRDGAGLLTFLFPMVGSVVLIGAIGGATEPSSVAGIVSLVTGTLGAGFLTARTLWVSSTRRFKKKLARLMEALTTSTDRAALKSRPEEETD